MSPSHEAQTRADAADLAGRINLYDLAPALLASALSDAVEPPFRAKQVAEWAHRGGVSSFGSMTNLPKQVREALGQRFDLSFPQVSERTDSSPDGSRKYLFRLRDGNVIESVYMPMSDRTTVCVSSQAGCAVGCTFCVTGIFGAGRNLSPSEIVGQYYTIRNEQKVASEQMNVVFMGMGEPLLNLDHVMTSLEILYRDISPRRVTLSTSGIIPGIEVVAAMKHRPNLAVSINAPDKSRREQVMPITKKYPLDELMESLRAFPLERGRSITAEYVLIDKFNDSAADAGQLARLLRGIDAKVNVIPLNEDPHLADWMKRPSDAVIDRFARTLVKNGVHVTVRRSKGLDIAAACGQLRGRNTKRRAE
ncbi:MAG TPA: 23S rRNA (adenine(2503)-C(2))-methyltransferase RlmN [Thermoanaerobaculia bacterium]|nr:23S rRNA (adenine(2503)-C(2))-methyltransferase RlmN [Thermoanaerobaculia bacterium]